MIDRLLFIILVIAMGGTLQRGVPILSSISWPTYKIIVVAISIFYVLRIISNKDVRINRSLFLYGIFLGINLLWAVVSGINRHFSYLSGLLAGLLPLFPLYFLRWKGLISNTHLKYSLLFLIIVSVVSFFGWNTQILEEKNIDFFTNNIGYYFVPLFPVVYFLRNNLSKYIVIVLLTFFVLASAKRGALFCLLFELILYLYVMYFRNKKLGTFQKIVAGAGAVLSIFLVTTYFSDDSYTMQRINNTFNSSDKTDIYSGRDVIYTTYLNDYISSEPKDIFLGRGFNATMDIYELNAHNDWIEILVDYGLIAAIVYLIFFVSTFRIARKTNILLYRYALYSVIGTMFIQTLFSMGFTSMSMCVTAMMLGYLFSAIYVSERNSTCASINK